MKLFTLPNTDLTISELGLGTWGLGGPVAVDGVALGWPAIERREVERIIRSALDGGIRLIDTSDMYGTGMVESILGGVARDHVVIGTKGGLHPAFVPGTDSLFRRFDVGYLTGALESSLRRLRRDTIDLYQLHGARADVIRAPETAEFIAAMTRQGKIRCAGVSLRGETVREDDIEAAVETSWVTTVQLAYNVMREGNGRHLSRIRQAGKIAIMRSALEHGILVSGAHHAEAFGIEDHRARKCDAELLARIASFHRDLRLEFGEEAGAATLLSWTRAPSEAQVVLIGARRMAHVERALREFDNLAITDDQRKLIAELARRHALAR
jgi:aryl-alcohol dehydrogenase-like predicted oxidoreductase